MIVKFITVAEYALSLCMLLQVCLQKEQESRVSMELQVTRMEEHLDQVTSELSLAHEERRRLDEELEQAQRRNMVHT